MVDIVLEYVFMTLTVQLTLNMKSIQRLEQFKREFKCQKGQDQKGILSKVNGMDMTREINVRKT